MLRKTMPKNSKKPTRSKLVKKLDVVFSQYIRLKNSKNGICTCVTCGKKGHWKTGGIQAGHFMSRKHYSTRWDEDNVKPQCVGCNMFRSGEQYKYSLYLGKQLSENLHQKSNKIVKFTNIELEEMFKHYSDEVKKLL
tara:strand:- start:119 stop:529 length:411 start_codon:yes stop_codon:yes gene_type:complete